MTMVLFHASNIERSIYSPFRSMEMRYSMEIENFIQNLVQCGTKWVSEE